MFKWLFVYWKNNIDSVALDFKINSWAYINAKLFKTKISNYIVYFILALNKLNIKSLKIFYKNFSFELIYTKVVYFLILLVFLLFII